MIVQPDFADHWKTQALVAATGDEAAPMMVIRLWSHCHYRRTSKFKNLSDIALAGICKWKRDPAQIREILLACGFIELKNDTVIVHDWDNVNSSLIARWRGGETNRRRLVAKAKLRDSLPISSPTSEKRRVEKSREDKIEKKDVGANGSRPKQSFTEWLASLSADPAYQGIDVAREYQKMSRWCEVNKKQGTSRRFINWLNRVERPIQNDLASSQPKKGVNVW